MSELIISNKEDLDNIADTSSLVIVGNGTNASSRGNAYKLDKDGDGWFTGSVEASAIILRSSTAGSTKLLNLQLMIMAN